MGTGRLGRGLHAVLRVATCGNVLRREQSRTSHAVPVFNRGRTTDEPYKASAPGFPAPDPPHPTPRQILVDRTASPEDAALAELGPGAQLEVGRGGMGEVHVIGMTGIGTLSSVAVWQRDGGSRAVLSSCHRTTPHGGQPGAWRCSRRPGQAQG